MIAAFASNPEPPKASPPTSGPIPGPTDGTLPAATVRICPDSTGNQPFSAWKLAIVREASYTKLTARRVQQTPSRSLRIRRRRMLSGQVGFAQ